MNIVKGLVERRMNDGVGERVGVTVIRMASLSIKLSENKHSKCYLNNSWVSGVLWGFVVCFCFLIKRLPFC